MKSATDDADMNTHGGGEFPREIQILCLPEEVLENAASYLSVTHVLSLLSVNRRLYRFGKSVAFWEMLSERDCVSWHEEHTKTRQSQTPQVTCYDTDDNDEACFWRTAKYSYLFHCQKSNPTKSGGGVHWYPVRPHGGFAGISDREGHLSCVLSRQAISHQKDDPLQPSLSEEERRHAKPQERIVVITGGFSDDDSVHLIHAGTGTNRVVADKSGSPHPWEMKRLDSSGGGNSFVYGATLTALPTQYAETAYGLTATMRAVRFGGFRDGGYSNETSQVSMLTIKQESTKVRRQRRRGKRERQHENNADDDDNQESWSSLEWQWDRPREANWSNIAPTGIEPGDNDHADSLERDFLSRAYHTSVLLLDRYLVVIGGMKSTGSTLNEAILDTKTWTWIGYGCIACGSDCMDSRPSGRHGHSVVLDDTRNRLVLFGGGSGSDLLRSGKDNSEVWELQLGNNWSDSEKFAESFPWKWKKLHDDSDSNKDNNNNGGGEETNGEPAGCDFSKLTPSESLCLGRCHHGIKISRDTVLLLFGSGRPSTNGLLAYDLKTDSFFRHQQSPNQLLSSSLPTNIFDTTSTSDVVHVKGILPKPRFTGVAVFLEEDGYIITHGGYCSQDHDTIGTIDVLDLAPGFRGRLNRSSSFNGLAIDDRRVSYGEVTDAQAERGRRDPNVILQQMLETLINTPAGDRQFLATDMLNQMNAGELPSNAQSFALMQMIANGSPLLVGNDDDAKNSD